MKRFILMLAMLGSILTAIADGIVVPAPKDVEISSETALVAAKRTFKEEGTVVLAHDYYLIKDNDSTQWTFLVDPLPDAGWEHKSYLATVPKVINSKLLAFLSASLDSINCPPDVEMTLMASHATLRFDTSKKPFVAYGSLSPGETEAANRTYAVILNGGINKNANHERNWNDCSFIYQTLVKKLGVPKGNISVLMADGTDPADDMRAYGSMYASSPLDLDFDGEPDIQYAATVENVKNVFSRLTGKMRRDDHLLFFVAGAGGFANDTASFHYIRLWGDERISDLTLDGMLKPLLIKGVTVNTVFGQSYGGGMLSRLSAPGCVTTSATDASSLPTSCFDMPYSEFLYWWTSAINRANAYGSPVEADLDGDGLVSMAEAASFAKDKVAATQYASNPAYLGAELSFGSLAETTNLYIKDNHADNGTEPNPTTVFWDSPSVWVRNRDDGGTEHETISYSENNGTAYVYVKIHNCGKDVAGGTGRCVDLYWAQASTAIADRTWTGQETYGGHPTGGHIGKADIGSLASGDSAVVKVEWQLPSFFQHIPDGNFQFCVGARMPSKGIILSSSAYADTNELITPGKKRTQAVKSVSVVAPANVFNGEKAYVRNTSRLKKTYSLSLVPRTNRDAGIFAGVNLIQLEMDAVLFNAWKNGGRQGTGILELASAGGAPSKIRFTNRANSIDGIELNGRALATATMKMNIVSQFENIPKFVLDLVQKDSDGNIVGAVTFELRKGSQTSAANEYELAAVGQDELADELSAEEGIKVVTPAAAGDRLTVELLSPAPANASLAVSSVLDGPICATAALPPGDTMAEINTATMKPGIYAVAYTVDGALTDTATFTKR